MTSPALVEKFYGLGNYILIDCNHDFTKYFLLTGYNILPIKRNDINRVNVEGNIEYKFAIISINRNWNESDFNGLNQLLSRIQTLHNIFVTTVDAEADKIEFNAATNVIFKAGFEIDNSLYKESNPGYSLFMRRCINNELTEKSVLDHLAEVELCAELNGYIRPNEHICIVHKSYDVFLGYFNQYSNAGRVEGYSTNEDFYNNCKINEIGWGGGVSQLENYYDCIFLLNDDNKLNGFESLEDLTKCLSPGGRVIICSDRFNPLSLNSDFEIEVAYHLQHNQDFIKKFGCKEVIGKFKNYYVLMKNPFNNLSQFNFHEKTYLYSKPPKNLLNFANDYVNPWLIKSMVEFPTRNKNEFALARYAKQILREYNNLSPDYGAALAILGYQELKNEQHDRQVLNDIINYINSVSVISQKSPHQIRWFISLSVLAAELLKIRNLRDEALNLYLKTLTLDYLEFSPTIGTKVLQAYYNIVVIHYCNGNIYEAEKYLIESLHQSIKLLNVSFEELLGNVEKPLTFTLYIYHDILDWMIKLTNLKNNLGKKNNLIPRLNLQTWSGMLKERLDAISNMNNLIQSRDEAISSQGEMLEERWLAMQNMNEVINSQKILIEERWNAMQNMERLIEERWNSMMEMEKMIIERDKTIEQLSKPQ